MRNKKPVLTPDQKMDILRREFPGDSGLKRLEEKLVNFHRVASEVQARNEARGYEYGWVNGRFVVTKYPDGAKS